MSQRLPVAIIAPLLAFIGLAALSPARAAEKPLAAKPNIVLFFADDLGWTGLRCFGSDFYETPNLDHLAESGMKFTDAYAACTVCSPSRAALMTGLYPARLHLTSFIPGQDRPFAKLSIPDWTKGLDSKYTTLPEALKADGYRTIHVGKWHLNFPGQAADPTLHGFDFSADKPAGTKGYYLPDTTVEKLGKKTNYLTDHLADVAVEQISKAGDDPFFLYFAFHVPHTPIQGRDDLVEQFEGKVNTDATHRNPTYAAMVKSMDLAVGRVLDQLEAQGVADETLIIFTSDNGGLTQRNGVHDNFTENLPLRRGKGSAYEGGVRVPTIISWPGVTEAGSVCDEPIHGIDFFPTLLDIAGVESDASPDGVSFKSLLGNPDRSLARDLYWHFPHYHAGGDSPYSAVRSKNWRLIEFHEDESVELYDLSDDIGESKNLAADRPDIAAKLHANLKEWRNAVGAQMPTENPNFDTAKQGGTAKRKKKAK
jgi:arylsulfatase A-like enzyme